MIWFKGLIKLNWRINKAAHNLVRWDAVMFHKHQNMFTSADRPLDGARRDQAWSAVKPWRETLFCT